MLELLGDKTTERPYSLSILNVDVEIQKFGGDKELFYSDIEMFVGQILARRI